jgi:UPF0716 protein FxsA
VSPDKTVPGVRALLRFPERHYFFRLIFVFLLYSLIPLGEIFLFLYVGNLIGYYLVIALAAVLGVCGAAAGLGQVERAVRRLRAALKSEEYPGRELADIAGLILAGVLLVTPGFVTDLCGLALLVPSCREALAKLAARKLERVFRELFEHLRLERMRGGSTA